MDYLRTLGSAAVSTLVQKTGLNLPFSLGTKVASLSGGCSLYDATRKDNSTQVSVFEYEFNGNQKHSSLAKNALRKLRTIRHPDVLKYMDAVESDTMIYIMTERVKPLNAILDSWSTKSAQEREDWLIWGLHRISVALSFINEECASTHGAISTSSIFISPSGEWKLGSFELLSNPNDEAAVLYSLGGVPVDSMKWAPPEVKSGGWEVLKKENVHAADAYGLGLLLNAIFNPGTHPPLTSNPPHNPPAANSRLAIPASLFTLYKKLLNPNPKLRLSPKSFLEAGMVENGFFRNNRLVRVCTGLENFSVSSEADKSAFLKLLKDSASSLPTEFATHRVIPSLGSMLDFGGTSAAVVLPLLLEFGNGVSKDEYNTVVLVPLVKLYASPDRGIRMALLDHLPEYIDHLDRKIVESKIFPNLQTGFSDTVAVIREATIKSIILLAPKFGDRILNNDLLRHLARLQSDPEPSIRTNTCILIGRLGPSLGHHTKQKVLVPAFAKALKDSFVHTRVAGLMSFMATIECFENDDIATKVIPNISSAMVDKEKLVRDQAFKAIDLFMKKLEGYVATLPETVSETESAIANPQAALVNSAAGAAGALAGWAISSLGKRLASGDMQGNLATVEGSSTQRPASAPPGIDDDTITKHHHGLLQPQSTLLSATRAPKSSDGKGLQLGTKKNSTAVADEWAIESFGVNAWGNGDLIDVNADQDDWSAFETATAKPSLSNSSDKSQSSGPLFASKPLSEVTDSDDWGTWTSNTNEKPKVLGASSKKVNAPLSKEEKATEMARRREERRQRIAQLKEQKKQGEPS